MLGMKCAKSCHLHHRLLHGSLLILKFNKMSYIRASPKLISPLTRHNGPKQSLGQKKLYQTLENGLLTARMWPLKCHQDENNRLGPFSGKNLQKFLEKISQNINISIKKGPGNNPIYPGNVSGWAGNMSQSPGVITGT